MNKLKAILCIGGLFSLVLGLSWESKSDGQFLSGPSTLPPVTPAQIAFHAKEGRYQRQVAIDLLNGHYSRAEFETREEIAYAGADALTEPYLALALDAEGKDQEALQVFNQLYTGGEWLPGILLPYAELLLKHGQWVKALAVYNRALPEVGGGPENGHQLLLEDSNFTADDPQPADLEVHIHIALAMAGDYVNGADGHNHMDRSVAEAKKALDIDPDSPLANLEYADALTDAGRPADARAVYLRVIAKYKGDIKASAEEGIFYTPAAPGAVH